jgi:retron-type reverse transcriptase
MPIDGYLVKYNQIPTQLCPTDTFRSVILGQGSGAASLLVKNKNTWGIPQGTPISDILVNIYMIDFDKKIHEMAANANGFYFRYSDNIIIIAQISADNAINFKNQVAIEIEKYGSELKIKDSKSAIV